MTKWKMDSQVGTEIWASFPLEPDLSMREYVVMQPEFHRAQPTRIEMQPEQSFQTEPKPSRLNLGTGAPNLKKFNYNTMSPAEVGSQKTMSP